jgi:hypothetical protein
MATENNHTHTDSLHVLIELIDSFSTETTLDPSDTNVRSIGLLRSWALLIGEHDWRRCRLTWVRPATKQQ